MKTTYTLLYSIVVILTAQITVNLFIDNFVISGGVIVFALLMLLLDEFAAIPVVFLSAAGVMITRSIASSGHMISSAQIWKIGMPEFIFYIVYGVLIYLLYNYVYKGRSEWLLAIVLIVPDFLANVAELYIRIGSDIGNSSTILILLAVAIIRSVIVFGIYRFIIHHGIKIVRMPRGSIEAVDHEIDQEMVEAHRKALDLYHDLEMIKAPSSLVQKAKELADEIDKAKGGKR